MHGFPKTFIQPAAHLPFRNPLSPIDDPFGDFTSGEVRGINQEFIEDRKLQEAGHND